MSKLAYGFVVPPPPNRAGAPFLSNYTSEGKCIILLSGMNERHVWQKPTFDRITPDMVKALRAQDQLVASIRASLVGSTSLPPEAAPKVENKSRTFDKVVFGHHFSRFDRDQLIAYYVAVKVGAIDLNTPISFTADPTATDLHDSHTLVIEPYLDPSEPTASMKMGNYVTGPQDVNRQRRFLLSTLVVKSKRCQKALPLAS